MNKVRSSRDLEKACHISVEVMWLMKSLAPDHNTISNFRRDNKKAIKKVFRAAVELAKNFDLIGSKLIAGDIQFRAVGNTAKPKLGTQNTAELTKSLFTDLRKGTDAAVISSAGGMEFDMEGEDWQNGLFTYCFINGIKTKGC
ncbi:MAG: transposase [Putridiphycobacter sp.]|nr:transposase [Putridiphycobacter sp.]